MITLRFIGASVLFGVVATAAAATPPATPPTSEQPAQKSQANAMTADSTVMTQLAVFLREYHRALTKGDRQYLSDHTTLPMSFSEGVLDMEAKAQTQTLETVNALLKVKKSLLWPQALVPKNPEHLATLKRGVEKCHDEKHPDVPDWSQGEPALSVTGDEASLTYINAPCESATHMVTLTFKREGKTWRLRERSIRVGAK